MQRGGGNWMGVDYVNLSTAPAAAYPLTESRWVVTQGGDGVEGSL